MWLFRTFGYGVLQVFTLLLFYILDFMLSSTSAVKCVCIWNKDVSSVHVCLFVCLSVFLTSMIWCFNAVSLSICLFVCHSAYLSVFYTLSIYQSIYLSINLSIYLSFCIQELLSFSVCLSPCLFDRLSVCLSLCLSVR